MVDLPKREDPGDQINAHISSQLGELMKQIAILQGKLAVEEKYSAQLEAMLGKEASDGDSDDKHHNSAGNANGKSKSSGRKAGADDGRSDRPLS